jgi:hypothetical protein
MIPGQSAPRSRRSASGKSSGTTRPSLSGLVGELAALKEDATHWLTDPEYAALHYS